MQKGQPKEADTETSDDSSSESDGKGVDESNTAIEKNNTTSGSTRSMASTPGHRTSTASNQPLNDESPKNQLSAQGTETDKDEPDTQLLDNHGSSGMNFVVTQSNASSVQLPAPENAVSNPSVQSVPEMSFADFLKNVDGLNRHQKPNDDQADSEDFKLSSTESSAED